MASRPEGTPWNVPNLLSGLRMVLAPIFLVLYVTGNTQRALAAFAAAAATDVLDGIAARALDQRTRLGAFLDPIADKFLAACALFALAERGQLPWWLAVVVVSRDGAQLAGAAILRALHHLVPVTPTRIGKYATFTLAATVLLALAAQYSAHPEKVEPFVAALAVVTAECVLVSFLQYSLYFVRSIRAQPGLDSNR